ncbi:MAG: acyl--CoA ligase, partial [Chlorobiales bacterium]|nr:acyl--CoA ligase [Chlorobiales bacterium]
MNISDILIQQAEKLGDTPCIYQDDGVWTFSELDLKVWQFARKLRKEGVSAGDIVVHTFKSQPLQFIAMMATARIGASVFTVPLNTPSGRRKALLGSVNASFFVTDLPNTRYEGLMTIPVTLKSVTENSRPADKRIRKKKPTAPWIIIPGSGSTGRLKFLPILHSQQWERMQLGLNWLPYSEKDLFVSLIHLDFYTSKQRCLEALNKGAAIALFDRSPLNFHDEDRQDRVTVIYGTVFHVERMLKSLPLNAKGHMESLTALMLNCSTVSSSLREKIRERLCSKLFVLYGTNESGTVCSTDLTNVYETPGTVGRPHKGFELQVIGSDDSPLPTGQTGHIRIRSKAGINGYFRNDELTAMAFRNGWFYPGDLGRLTEGNQLIHLGRADDMMIMNGINIYPAEIEEVLSSYPGVHNASAMPLKHEVYQDIPVCAVILEKNARVTGQDMLVFARKQLGSHAPHRVVILESIPYNDQGKPDRAELRKMIVAQMQQANPQTERPEKLLKPSYGDLQVKQLQKRFSFSFIMPEKPDIAALDLWLDKVLGNDLKTDEEVNFPGGNDV